MLDKQYLKRIDSPYSPSKALKLVILIRGSSDQARAMFMYELFKLMNKVILKNIENYNFLCKPHSNGRQLIEETEVISECWIALEKCVKNFGAEKTGNVRYNVFKIKQGTQDEYIYDYSKSKSLDFYFYYNKALTQRLTRIVRENVARIIQTEYTIKQDRIQKPITKDLDVQHLRERGLTPKQILFCFLKYRGYNTFEIIRIMKTNMKTISEMKIEIEKILRNHE